jgi:nucleoid DNA-binding protein
MELCVMRALHEPKRGDEPDAAYSRRRTREIQIIGNVLREAYSVMKVALVSQGRKVILPGIGTLERSTLKSRVYRHPRTGEMIQSTSRHSLRFNTSPLMRQALLEIPDAH